MFDVIVGSIKKFINSDLTKPLNTLIDEVKSTLNLIKAKTDTITADLFTATHASRIDATISSRQANAGLTTTHAGRIDASISSRASQASLDALATGSGVWSANGRTLSHIRPSSTARISVATERASSTVTYNFLMKSTGAVNISFDIGVVTGGGAGATVSVRARGVEITTFTINNLGTTYLSRTINSLVVTSGFVEIVFTSSNGNPKVRNFNIMYDYDNTDTPTLL